MKKIIYGVLLLFVISSVFGCISKEEEEKARKYEAEYVYIAETLELKEKPYKKTFEFIAKYSSDRFRMELYYLNFSPDFANKDGVKTFEIHESLLGLSVKMHDRVGNQLILSDEINKKDDPYFSISTPSLFLTADYEVKRGHKYQITVEVPAKKNTKEAYLCPTLVAEIAEAPSL